jgi:hypothetical protein
MTKPDHSPTPQARAGASRWFFTSLAALLIVVVAVGFAPSFYLSGIISPAPQQALPAYIVLHGIALTLWFLLLFAQSLLVATRRADLHRLLGRFGAVLAIAVLGLSGMVVVRSAPHFRAEGLSTAETGLRVFGDFGLLLLFAIKVALGIRFRRRADVHKRCMALASIDIVGPAIVRWPGAYAWLPLSVAVPQLALFGVMAAHDFFSGRRLHKATVWSVIAYVAVIAASVCLASSAAGQGLIQSLG